MKFDKPKKPYALLIDQFLKEPSLVEITESFESVDAVNAQKKKSGGVSYDQYNSSGNSYFESKFRSEKKDEVTELKRQLQGTKVFLNMIIHELRNPTT